MLTRHRYVCVACGAQQTITTKDDEVPVRRATRRCTSRQCKEGRRIFRPAYRPITGRYREAKVSTLTRR